MTSRLLSSQGPAAAMTLRLSLFNPIDPDRPVAERELALRFAQAMTGLGWQAGIHHRSDQVRTFNPDAVLNLFPVAAPKLTDHPWLGCAWGPPSIIEGMKAADRDLAAVNELSHDAYLVSGESLELHLRGRLAVAGRSAPMRAMHVSSPRSSRKPGLGPDSRLFYVGSNWDGLRFPHLMARLAEEGALALYGAAARWSHLPGAYQGELPFDGRSVIDAAHHWGMGLCLHLPQHRADGVPNMRVFELAAAGAVIVSDQHPFIEHWFGDSVLYVGTDEGEAAAAADILDRVAWIRANPATAREMAATAQAIFNRRLCLEELLAPLPDLLTELAGARRAGGPGGVAVLLPDGPGLAERLSMLAGQCGAPAVTALVPGGAELPPAMADITVRPLPGPADAAALLSAMGDAAGLAILPAWVEWHADHLARMREMAPTGRAALAAALWPRPAGTTGFPVDSAEEWSLAPLTTGGDEPALALLRAGALYCPVERLRGLQLAAADWRSLALDLPPALAAADGLAFHPVTSLRLIDPSPAGQPASLAWQPLSPVSSPARPPRVTGINDLSPALAADLPCLWSPADFDRLPPRGPIWLYGAGRGGELVMAALPATARARLRGFLDSRSRGEVQGLPLRCPQDLDPADMEPSTVIIASQYVSDMLRALQAGTVRPAHILNAYPYIADRVEADGRLVHMG